MSKPFDPGVNDQVTDFLVLIANRDPSAGEFMNLWHQYCHRVDDCIDENLWDAERLLALFMLACEVYSSPFYVRHCASLRMPALIATSVYADSINFERSPELWKRQWAEVMRHAGNDMAYAVAMITGGWKHLRKIGRPLWAASYIYRADRYGVPK